jgi:flavin-dependent dehydrogenase
MGAPVKIGDAERKQVLAVVGVGGSLRDAAGIIGCTAQTIRNHMRGDPTFLAGVRKAAKSGKMKLVQRVANAPAWQAAAWLLERRFGAEFGRKEFKEIRSRRTVKHEHEHRHAVDLDAIARDLEQFAGGRIPADGNGQPVHTDSAEPASGTLPRLAGS